MTEANIWKILHTCQHTRFHKRTLNSTPTGIRNVIDINYVDTIIDIIVLIYCDIYRYLSISVYDLNLFKKFKQTILYVFLGIKDSNEHMVKLIEHTWQEFEIETEISIEDLLLVYWRLIVIIQETKCRLPIH